MKHNLKLQRLSKLKDLKVRRAVTASLYCVHLHTVMCRADYRTTTTLTNGSALRPQMSHENTYLTLSIYLVSIMFVIYNQIKTELLEFSVLLF